MELRRLLLLIKVLSVHDIFGLLKYIVFNKEYSVKIYGKNIVLYPMGNILDRLRFSIGKSIEAVIAKYVEEERVDRAAQLLGLDSAWFEDNSVCAKIGNMKLYAPREYALRLLYTLREVFIKKIYGEPKGMQVIDVGAWIGDTSIYFALQNKLVIGLEPVERFFTYFKRNTKVNGLETKIIPLNAAYSLSNSYVKIIENGLRSRIHPKGNMVKAVNLQSIIEEYGLDNVFLKVDCEGCEYELIKEIPLIKNYVSKIAVEVHKDMGDSSSFIEELRNNGFRIQKVLENPKVIVLRGTRSQLE